MATTTEYPTLPSQRNIFNNNVSCHHQERRHYRHLIQPVLASHSFSATSSERSFQPPDRKLTRHLSRTAKHTSADLQQQSHASSMESILPQTTLLTTGNGNSRIPDSASGFKLSVSSNLEGSSRWLRTLSRTANDAERTTTAANENLAVKLIIIGGKQVGKSALTVRYLTKRYIGEYQSNSDVQYRHRLQLDGQVVELEIVDVSDRPGQPHHLHTDRVRTCDAVVVMYSVTDRASFIAAAEALDALADVSGAPPTVLLLANKVDLSHIRKVSVSEGLDLAQRFNTEFHEVSVADNPVDTVSIMNRIVKEIWREKLDGHFLLRPPQSSSASPISSSSASTASNASSTPKSRDASPLKSPPADPTDRTRKVSVFNVGRVFSSLMGRGSLPPDLSSSSSSTTSSSSPGQQMRERSVSAVAAASDRLSLKNVFKKRSV